jgi:flavin-dependent dehydrogenase
MPKRDDPVVIAGAGPAGSTLAIRLRKLGLDVTLVERYKFPRQKLCGEFISPECLRHFDDLGVLGEMLSAGGDRIHETVFYETGGRKISVPSRWFDDGGFALSLSRARMDEILLNAARRAGVTVLEETTVTGLLKENGSVQGVKVRDAGGKTREIEAAMTVDATGRARVLSRLADKQAAHKEPKPRFVGFKAHFTGVEMTSGVCEMYAFRGGYAGLSFVEGGEANLCFIARSSLLDGTSDADDILKKLTKQNVRARRTLASAKKVHDWLAVSVPAFGLNQFPSADGLFAVGDSAAFVDPFTGSGMLLAIESAATLAESIEAAGRDPDAIRSLYTHTYQTRFSSRLKVSGLIRYVAYEPLLSTAAVLTLSASRRLRESLARRTRSTRSTEGL